MKIGTWNINSIRARADRVLDVLKRHDIDVLALQETKCTPAQFPAHVFEQAGYQVAACGVNQWNGVAVISRVGIANVSTYFPDQPGFPDVSVPEPRAIGVNVGEGADAIELWSIYVPNGRAVGHPHYTYKLNFLHSLCRYASHRISTPGSEPGSEASGAPHLLFAGDWNVIPTDEDVWDRGALDSELYMTPEERDAFFSFEKIGMHEVTRSLANNYTYWDYQKLRFPRNEGMRIDYMYANERLAHAASSCMIDRNERKGKGASDHVPVIVCFDI